MEMEKSKVLIQFLVIFRHCGDVLSFLYACRLSGYAATPVLVLAKSYSQQTRWRRIYKFTIILYIGVYLWKEKSRSVPILSNLFGFRNEKAVSQFDLNLNFGEKNGKIYARRIDKLQEKI